MARSTRYKILFNISMSDWISKFLVAGIVFISLSSIMVTGYKYFFEQDYLVQATVDCDPSSEKCFVSICNNEEEECSSIPEENISYYKIFEQSAKNLPACSFGEVCGEMVCETSEGCVEIFCNEDLFLEIGDKCSDSPISLQEVEADVIGEDTEEVFESAE